MSKIISVCQAFFGILFILFSLFNIVRSIIDGSIFPVFVFIILLVLSFGWTIESIKDIRDGE